MAEAKFKTLKLMFLSRLFYCFIGILKQLNISAKQLLDLLLILMTYVVNLYKKQENCKKLQRNDFFADIQKARFIK